VWVEGLGLQVEGLGVGAEGLGVWVEGLGVRVEGLGFRADILRIVTLARANYHYPPPGMPASVPGKLPQPVYRGYSILRTRTAPRMVLGLALP
jgi:hypothetical protein